jgi:hypothetical protein
MSDVIPHPAFDFSSYHPGDVIRISRDTIGKMGYTAGIQLVAAITNAAVRAGLDWKAEMDNTTNDLEISFTEAD